MRLFRAVVFSLVAVFFAAPAWGQVAFGAVTEANSATSGFSFTGPTVSGSNTVGVVQVQCGSPSALSNFAVTWGGAAMTLFGGPTSRAGAARNIQVVVFSKTAPSSAGAIVTSWTGTADTCYVGASSWSGVDQTTPMASYTTNSGTGACSVTLSGTAGANDLTVNGCHSDSNVMTDDGNQTHMYVDNGGCCGADGQRNGTGSPTFTATTSGDRLAYAAIIKAVSAAAAPAPPQRLLLGVGQ